MTVQIKQDTNANRLTYTPVNGELFWATDTKTMWIGDGTTAGGVALWDGTTTLSGVAYDDLIVPPNTLVGTGGAALLDATWLTNFKAISLVNGGGDYGYFSMQLPHNYVPGTDIHMHIHFTTPSNITSGQTVVFNLDYTVSVINGGFGSSATVTPTFTNDATARAAINAIAPDQLSTTTILPNTHMIAGGSTISGAGLTLSTVLYFRLSRNASDTYAGSAYPLSIDAHIQKNRLGSSSQYTG